MLPLARDFAGSTLPARGKSCIGCHMPEVERHVAVSLATGKPVGEPRRGRRHSLRGPSDAEFCADAFALDARLDERDVVVDVGNRAGHRVPGLRGREFRLAIQQRDRAGKIVQRDAVVFSAENPILVEETRTLRFARAAAIVDVEVVLTHALGRAETELVRKVFR